MSGKTIKRMRQQLGMTQTELAIKLGVTFVSVNRWENGVSHPSPLAVKALKTLKKRFHL